MGGIRYHAPNQLPEGPLSEQAFQKYKTELEMFLSMEDKFALFLPGETYSVWRPGEEGENRIKDKKQVKADDDVTLIDDTVSLSLRNKHLKVFLTIVAKTVAESHYSTVMKHSTSLEWIYEELRKDYDIQTKGIHFLNLIDLKYDENTMTPVGFYNHYRTVIVNNLKKKNDVIKWKSNTTLAADETISATFEDFIFLQVLFLIDSRLPAHIRQAYAHKLGKDQTLMDFKSDIFVNIKQFKKDMAEKEQLTSLRAETAHLANFVARGRAGGYPAFGGGGGRGSRGTNRGSFPFRGSFSRGAAGGRGAPPPGQSTTSSGNQKRSSIHCGACYHFYKDREDIYNSHNRGDPNCPSKSYNTNLGTEEHAPEEEEEEAQQWDYSVQEPSASGLEYNFNQVDPNLPHLSYLQLSLTHVYNTHVTDRPHLGSIKPEPFQFLTVFQDPKQTVVLHMMLDSGANVSYILKDEAIKRGFNILPCSQLSTLGDGDSLLGSIGEIDETFYRNGWTVKFRALVVPKLQSRILGGLTFMKDNKVIQDIDRGTISIHDRKYTVMATAPEATMSVHPQGGKTMFQQKPAHLAHIQSGTSRTLLPGQSLYMPTEMNDGQTVVVEGWYTNDIDWPEAQLCSISNKKVLISNDTPEPITLGKKGQVGTFKISRAEETDVHDIPLSPPSYYKFKPDKDKSGNLSNNLEKISWGKDIPNSIKNELEEANRNYVEVFDESLKGGYNGAFGPFVCRLNWAGPTRPQSSKLKMVNYDHELKGLMQELMDDLTDDKVLADPQKLKKCTVQSVCPAFLRRKKRAAGKPKHMLTKNDVRLIINFSPINELIKPVPTPMPTPEEVFITLGKFKFIIAFDLYNGFFQNHMAPEDFQWLGVMTPFGGLRVITRSGQGLLGMSEEFNLLVRRIIKEELKEGKCTQLIDDIIVGGATREEATQNYTAILKKLHTANLKIAAEKTHIFPETVDILGWVWHQGGRLEPSPHRRNALANMRKDDIKKVRDMRSWIGLYKTLRIATPHISSILDPLEQAVADRQSNEDFAWTHELEMRFREAKDAVKTMHTLYLPSPDDKLCLDPDGAKQTPGIGHVLYAIKNNVKVPVRFHSVKLPESCKTWQPCEIEALGFATGIEAEYDLIRESKHPLLICPDSKVVADAVQLIKQGKYSASSRINKFLTNVNKVHLEVAHISGKAKLNSVGDNQSRHPSSCASEVCSVCRFVNEQVEEVVDSATKLTAVELVAVSNLQNRQAWKKAQDGCDSCKTAASHLRSGKTPSTKVGKVHSNVRQYCREAVIAKDNILVVREKPKAVTGDIPRERIVVPQKLLPTLLHHLHNSSAVHPVKTQLKQTFQRSFYAIDLDKHIEELYANCYPCSVLQSLPKVSVPSESKAEVEHPHQYFHADVIRRATQHILLLVDHFSSFQVAKLIPSEKACDLKEGLIILSAGVRHPGKITIKVDNAKGFESLCKNDKDLARLGIDLILSDVLNKNSNAVVDKSCQELEQELRKLSPEGTPVSQTCLAQAVLQVNKKFRRDGTLTAYEIHTARDSATGQNLSLNDEKLRAAQLDKRRAGRPPGHPNQQVIQIGDTVAVVGKQPKHNARDMFVVTGKDNNLIHSQKLIHPLGNQRLMSKVYTTDSKRLIVTHRPSIPPFPRPELPSPHNTVKESYDAVNQKFWDNDSSSDSDSEAEDDVLPPVLPEGVMMQADLGEADVGVEEDQESFEDAEEPNDEDIGEQEESENNSNSSVVSEEEEREAEIQDADVEDNDGEDEVEEEDDAYLDQSRRPLKGDVVSFQEGGVLGHWIEARVTSARTGTRYYYNVTVLDTGEQMGVWLRPAQATENGRQEAWQLGRRQDFMRSPPRPSSRRVSLESIPREVSFQDRDRSFSFSSAYEQ